MSYSTVRPIAHHPYDRQGRQRGPGSDMSSVAGPSSQVWEEGSTAPLLFRAETPQPRQQEDNNMLEAMRQMMADMEARMEQRIQQALLQPSPPTSQSSRSSRALPHIPRGAPPPPPGPPTPPPPPAPLVELPPAPQARNGPKMVRPEVFDGERAKCRGFIRNIEVYIFVNAYQFPNEATKVLYLLSYVQGKKVDNWKNTMTTKVLE